MTTTPSAPGTLADDEASRALQWAKDNVRDMMGVISRSAHPKDPLAGRHNYDLLKEVERHGEQIRDALARLKATTNAAQPQAVDVTGEAGEIERLTDDELAEALADADAEFGRTEQFGRLTGGAGLNARMVALDAETKRRGWIDGERPVSATTHAKG